LAICVIRLLTPYSHACDTLFSCGVGIVLYFDAVAGGLGVLLGAPIAVGIAAGAVCAVL